MRESLIAFFGPQERRLVVAGDEVVVRTLPDGADVEALKDGQDVVWKLMTRCTFYAADDSPAFTDADIETLKSAPRVRTLPLVRAVEAVNAFDLYAEVKNSEAVPSDG